MQGPDETTPPAKPFRLKGWHMPYLAARMNGGPPVEPHRPGETGRQLAARLKAEREAQIEAERQAAAAPPPVEKPKRKSRAKPKEASE